MARYRILKDSPDRKGGDIYEWSDTFNMYYN